MKEGVCTLGPWNPVVPAKVKEHIEKVKEDILTEKLKIWKGQSTIETST